MTTPEPDARESAVREELSDDRGEHGTPGDTPRGGGPRASRPRLWRALRVGARTTSGVVAVGIAVAVVLAAATVQLPSWSATPASTVITPVAAAGRLVCSGAPLRLADDTGAGASTASPLTTPIMTVVGEGVSGTAPVAQSTAGTGGTPDAPVIIDVSPGRDGAALPAAGAQSALLTAGDTRGLATETCTAPAGRQWLLAGSTTVGRTALLTVTNPTTVAAVVDLEIVTGSGPVAAPGMTGIDVPAGSQRVIPVSGFVLDAELIAVHVTSTGGNVTAALQSSVIRTLQPGGLDLAVPVGDPATTLTIPGVVVQDGAAVDAALERGAAWKDVAAAVRILAPGAAAEATVLLVPVGMPAAEAAETAAASDFDEGGEGASQVEADYTDARPRAFEVSVAAGGLVELPLPRLATGEYTVVVTATAPVLAAVRVGAVAPGAGDVPAADFAWAGPAERLPEVTAVAVPEAPDPRLAVANPGALDLEAVVEVDGAATPLTVPAGTTVMVELAPGAAVRLTGAGLVAAIVTGAEGTIAVSPVQPPAAASRLVTVYP